MFTPKRFSRTKGFTLVELLTVIAIIAVLMGILLPTINGAIENAKKTQAKNDETQLVAAIKSYYAEYGRYPIDTTTNTTDITYGTGGIKAGGTDQKILMNILRYPYKAADTNIPSYVNTLNPRKINFIEVRDAKNLSSADTTKQKEGISSDGRWLDPWGNEYAVRLDGDYDNFLANPYGANKNAGQKDLAIGVIVWTYGRDGSAGKKGGNGDVKGSDDVISWQ